MKYRLLDEETLGQMIDFLDNIQIEAAKGKYKDDIDKINMCSYLISEIINANEAMEIDDSDEDIEDITKGDGLYIDTPGLENLDDRDWKKMMEQLDAFFAGWEKANKRKLKKDKRNKNKKSTNIVNKKDEEEEYIPTAYDKFEQYYLEREMRKAIKESKTMDEMLYNLGLDLPPEELN
jgi:hypothetical protein